MKNLKTPISLVTLLMALAACTAATPAAPTFTPTPTASPAPTPTPMPTPTLTPTSIPGVLLPVTVGLWIPEGAVVWQLPDNHIWQIEYSPDGDLLAIASWKGLLIYDAATLELQLTIRPDSGINNMSWSPRVEQLAGELGDGVVRVWDVTTGEEMSAFKVGSGPIISVAWSPNGKWLASVSGKGELVQIWDVTTGKELVTLVVGDGAYYSVAWSPNGQRVAGGCGCGSLRVWDGTTGEVLADLADPDLVGITAWVNTVAWSPDGERLAGGLSALASEIGRVLIFDTATMAGLPTFTGYTDNEVISVAWSPDGAWLAGGTIDGAVHIWDASSGKKMAVLDYLGGVRDVVWSPDGKYLAIGTHEGLLIFWDASQLLG